MSILSFILYLIVAAVCAGIGSAVVPGRIPGGFLTAMIIGILGAWLGSLLMGSFGPALAGVALLPCIIGSALLVFLIAVISGNRAAV